VIPSAYPCSTLGPAYFGVTELSWRDGRLLGFFLQASFHEGSSLFFNFQELFIQVYDLPWKEVAKALLLLLLPECVSWGAAVITYNHVVLSPFSVF